MPAAVVVASLSVLRFGIYLDEVGLWIKPFGCRSTMFFLFFWGLQPWEEKMKSAQKQGTLVQLSNLDPSYTSKQVETSSLLSFRISFGMLLRKIARRKWYNALQFLVHTLV
ncbi:hypothetical protein C3L33_08909, partial [Rhododendron williamsianum]